MIKSIVLAVVNWFAKKKLKSRPEVWRVESCPHYKAFGEVGCNSCIIRYQGNRISFRKAELAK